MADSTEPQAPPAILAPPPRRARPGLRFGIRFAALVLVFFVALYFPHAPESRAARLLAWYVALQARLAGGLVHVFDRTASVAGNLVSGRFSLSIILDCAAVDAQALFAATVLAFPAPVRKKVIGLAAGLMAITVVNLIRIAALYFVGANWPRYFHLLHEDVFQFGIIAAACASFGLWALWVRGRWGRVQAVA